MNSSWTDRIKQIELTPPETGWDKIAASLDESLSGHEFPGRLYDLEAPLPVDSWNKIEKLLSGGEAPVAPVKRINNNRSLFLRYAVAACIIGLVSFAAIRLLSGPEINQPVAVTPPVSTPPAGLRTDKDSNSERTAATARAETEKDNRALEESKHMYARLDLPLRSLSTKFSTRLYNTPAQLSTSLPAETGLEKNPEIQYPHRAAVNDAPEDKDGNRYLMFKDSEGRFIKISKKLTSLFCCVSGEEPDKNCNDQLKIWREKIASSSFIPSPDNFMDILDLVSSLQDSRN